MNNIENTTQHSTERNGSCDAMPDLTRLRYFHGQMLGANDLQTEQKYFSDKLKLHNRCLHGYGTVCGLKVVAEPVSRDCDPQPQQQQQPTPPRARVRIECGLALDCEGNELVVRQTLPVDLWDLLDDAERRRVGDTLAKDGKARVYLSICYCVQMLDPVRPVVPDACSAVTECVYSKLRDSVRVKVSTERLREDHCRDNCCEKCQDKCLLLAAIDLFKDRPVGEAEIHNDVRRWITLYEAATITGINWSHGAAYTPSEAKNILQRGGVIINFSRPVLSETITDGVCDLWVIEGGRGRSGNIYNMAGTLVLPMDAHGNVFPTTTFVTFRQMTGETLQDGDRVLIILRADFILDECCRPLDGNHAGARVPYTRSDKQRDRLRNGREITQQKCLAPPHRYGPWTSGNGSPGGTFESWFYIKSPPEEPAYRDADADQDAGADQA